MANKLGIEVKTLFNITDDEAKQQLSAISQRVNQVLGGGIPIKVRLDSGDVKAQIDSLKTTLANLGNSGAASVNQVTAATQQTANAINALKTAYTSNSSKFRLNIANVDDIAPARAELEKFGTVTEKVFRSAEGALNGFLLTLKNSAGATENFRYSIDNAENAVAAFKLDNITQADASIRRLVESTEKWKASLEATQTKLKATVGSVSSSWGITGGGKSVTDEQHLATLNSMYQQIVDEIYTLEGADQNAAKVIIADINSQISGLKSLASAYHSAEVAATKLRTKSPAAVFNEYEQKLTEFKRVVGASDQGTIDAMSESMKKLDAAFQSFSADKSTAQVRAFLDIFETVKAEFKSENTLTKSFDGITKSVETATTRLKNMAGLDIFRVYANDPNVTALKDKIASIIEEYNLLYEALKNPANRNDQSFAELKARFDELTESEKQAKFATDDLKQSLRDDKAFAQVQNDVKTLTAQVQSYMEVNTKAAKKYNEQFQSILGGASQAAIAGDQVAVKQLDTQFKALQVTIAAAGDTGLTFFGRLRAEIKSLPLVSMYLSWNMLAMRAVRNIREMINTVTELDTAMTALRRVTDESAARYNQFLEKSIKNAKELKMNLVDLVTQSSEWAKRGTYSLDEVSQLSRASGIYSVVADIDNATAVQHLTTVMKTYGMTVDEVMSIVDKYDIVNNNFAVTAEDVGNAMSRSISALKTAGNTLDESIAMATTITEITGNAEEAGNALKTLSMRLRGAKVELQQAGEDTEGMAESTSKLREQIMALTNTTGKGGFDIMLDEETFKSTYEILQGISKVWQDISDVNQAALLELIAGKMRGNVVTVLLENMAQTNNVLETSINSAGTAINEYGYYLDSIQGRIQGFETAVQSLSEAFISGDDIKDLVSFGTSAISILENIIREFGSLRTIAVVTVTALSAFKNVGIFTTMTDQITGATNQLAIFGKTFSQIKNDFKKGYGLSFGISEADAAYLNVYATRIKNLTVDLKSGAISQEVYNEKLALANSSLTALSTTSQIAGQKILALRAQLDAGTISEAEFEAGTQRIIAAESSATVATGVLKTALATVFNVGITIAITSLITYFSDLKREQEEAAQATRDAAKEFDKTATSLEDYADKISKLTGELNNQNVTTERAKEIREELSKVQDDIIEKYGGEKKSVDEYTASIKENISALREQAEEEYKNFKQRDTMGEIENAVKTMENNINRYKFDPLGSQTKDILRRVGLKYTDMYTDIYTGSTTESSLAYTGSIYDFRKAIEQAQDELDKLKKEAEEVGDSKLAKSYQKDYRALGEILKQTDTSLESSEKLYEQYIKYESEYSTAYRNAVDAVSEYRYAQASGDEERINTAIDNLLTAKNTLLSIGDEGSAAVQILSKEFSGITQEIDNYKKSLEEAAKKTVFSDGTPKGTAYSEQLATLKETFDKALETRDTIQSAYDKLAKGTALDAATVNKLEAAYPGLLSKFTKTADGFTTELSNLEEANEGVTKSAKEALQAQVDIFTARQKQLESQISGARPNGGYEAEQLANLRKEYKENGEQIKAYNILLEMLALNEATAAEKAENLATTISNLSKKMKAVSEAFKEQSENESISVDTLTSLIENGYSAIIEYDKLTGAIKLNADAYLELAKAEIEAKIAEEDLLRTNALLEKQNINREITSAKGQNVSEFTARLKELDSEIADSTARRLAYNELLNNLPNVLSGKYGDTSSGSGKTEDTIKADFESQIKEIQHLYNMGLKSAEEYYNALEAANEQWYKNSAEHESDYLSNIEKIYKGRQEIYKKAANDELAILDEKLKLGYIKQEEYDKALVELAEKYYGEGTTYYGTQFAADEYKTLFDKSTSNDQEQYKEAFEKRLKELDSDLEKGRKTVREYRSEYAKLREEWWGGGSQWYGTTFAQEMYDEMSESLSDVDKLYTEMLDGLKEANDNSIDGEKTFVSDWVKLNEVMFEATDPKRYKENLDEINDYIKGLDDSINDYLSKYARTTGYDENNVQSRKAYAAEWGRTNYQNFGNSKSSLYNLDIYEQNLTELAKYQAETYKLMLDEGRISYEQFAEQIAGIRNRYKDRNGDFLLDMSFVSGYVNAQDEYEKFLTDAEKAQTDTLKLLNDLESKNDELKDLLSPAEYAANYNEIADRYLEYWKDRLEKGLIDPDTFSKMIQGLADRLKSEKGVDVGAAWLKAALGEISESDFLDAWDLTNRYDSSEDKDNFALRKQRADYMREVAETLYGKDGQDNLKAYNALLKQADEEEKQIMKDRAGQEQTYWQQQKSLAEEYYDKQIEALEKVNNEEERQNKAIKLRLTLIEAQQKLEDARRQKNQLIFENGTFSYVNDQDAILSAQDDVKSALEAIRDNELNEQVNLLKEQKDNASDFYDNILQLLQGYIDETKRIESSDSDLWKEIGDSESVKYVSSLLDNQINADDITALAQLPEVKRLVEALGGSATTESLNNFLNSAAQTGNELKQDVLTPTLEIEMGETLANVTVTVGDIIVNTQGVTSDEIADDICLKIAQSLSQKIPEALIQN